MDGLNSDRGSKPEKKVLNDHRSADQNAFCIY